MASVTETTTDISQYVGSWRLDPDKTQVALHTKALWVLPVKGTARAAGGEVNVDLDGTVHGQLEIDAASIDTKNKKRDAHLQTADFFEVEKYPTFIYAVTSARPIALGKVELVGALTVHGVTRPLTLQGEINGNGASTIISIDTEIDRSEWGVSLAPMGAGLKTRLVIDAHFDRQ